MAAKDIARHIFKNSSSVTNQVMSRLAVNPFYSVSNNTVKQRRSKAIDMCFYWIKDRASKGEFLIHWRCGADNLADYFTKHHSLVHHHLMHSCLYLLPSWAPPAPGPRIGHSNKVVVRVC